MNKLMMALAVAVFALSAQAAEEKKPTAQQSKMAACNKDAGDKKLEGDARKTFMKECLSAKADGRTAQQEKMKACNAGAGDKKGDERKAFMKECLSKKA
jgi:psiF repeat